MWNPTANITAKECLNHSEMLRSASASEICQSNEALSEMKHCDKEFSEKKDIMLKAQTLDRFARPSFHNHGEKRKKNFFSSFRLSKKAFGRNKDDPDSSSSDTSQNIKQEDESNSMEFNRPRKRYLFRMSSLVSRMTEKVQNVDPTNNKKLERSQTVLGNELISKDVEYIEFLNNTPGLMGIRNHGNTCFMNAVIQCLSHTDILSEYFVCDQYKGDLVRSNKINSKKYGTKGEITEQLAALMKSLWMLRYSSDISLNFKNIVEKYEPSYVGSNQHDAAEFLMFVLDKVHEDLNTASKRKYKKIKNSYGRPDDIVAAETLANHLRCNSSFVQAIFQAQFRSSLKCPKCSRESNTFDPYLFVSIPIPQKEILSLYVTVVYLNQQPKQVKLGLTIKASATIKELRGALAMDCGIFEDDLILTELDGMGFHRTFSDNSCVNMIKSTDPIYAIELPTNNSEEKDGFLIITWVNVLKADIYNVRFGGVFQSLVTRDISYGDFQKLLLKEMSTMVTNQTLVSEQETGIFSICVSTGSEEMPILDKGLDLPLFHESIEDALSLCNPLSGNPHVKFVLVWEKECKEKYITDDIDHVDEHATVEELRNNVPESPPVTLNECLQLHTSIEMLSMGDAWLCPTCNKKLQVSKRLTLWSAPQILVLHLKRFKQNTLDLNSTKLTTGVTYPLHGFDISEHMATCNGSNEEHVKSMGGVWSPWKRSKKCFSSGCSTIYDLFAVSNHHGKDLQGGHYTATCRNPTNNKWYKFDDYHHEEIPAEKVVSNNAYILFYQRRDDKNAMDQCHSSDGHWAYRIPTYCIPQNLSNVNTISNLTNGFSENDTDCEQKDDVIENTSEESNSNGETELSKEIKESEIIPIHTPVKVADQRERLNAPTQADVPCSSSAPETRSIMCDSIISKQESTPEVRITPASEEVSREYRAKINNARIKSSSNSFTSSPSVRANIKSSSDSFVSSPSVRASINSSSNSLASSPETCKASSHDSKVSSYIVIKTPPRSSPINIKMAKDTECIKNKPSSIIMTESTV